MPKKHHTKQTVAARQQLARNLRAAMAETGMKPAELAAKVKVGPSTVGDWLSGRSAPSLENLLLVATIVRQSVSWLVGDALHGLDTLEQYQQELAVRLGGERLRGLRNVPDDVLLGQLDLLIRSHPDTDETSIEPVKSRKRRSSARK